MNMPASGNLPLIQLKTERRSNHPWIFQKMVEKPVNKPKPGSIVDIVDREGQFAGRGFYNGHSRIALRVLTGDPDEAVDEAFFARKIGTAIALRREVLKLDAVTDACRLIHSEGDGLSGLVVDRFANTLVIEFFSAGMFRQRDLIKRILLEHFPGADTYAFAEDHVQKQESFDLSHPPTPKPTVIHEHGVAFHAAPGSKHKTGFFADQRDNRLLLAQWCQGKSVLDLCCNSGGFGIHAKTIGGASEVTGIDLDEEILEIAERNARLNKVKIKFIQADIFSWLRDVAASPDKKFDVVILDPAKMTRDREQVIPALKKYLDMNKLALGAVKPGGIFLTCSCTGLVSEEQFLDMLRRAAFYANRSVQVLKVTGAGADHPWLAHVPESRYLKAAFCRVE
ncbi:MAG: class I SAM-dependent rRNA methyltransferase [Dokdonella sp.]|uniref:class I SAM-dependent rRNA methyltransferase n=1 Tax=Dokdonella sp. TaxID=2291710 RepID=UPI0025BF30D5|nr:class I SAM-dependent rRNA methyltransferase [Dokdonella sp.]MBZ0223715.1 class I SAM-dependent rRNA methyltransferase [Dokdonella sp.]MCC7255316.1 class I SAM-dependent rRNA methyltransferase [Dokdonella sp.]